MRRYDSSDAEKVDGKILIRKSIKMTMKTIKKRESAILLRTVVQQNMVKIKIHPFEYKVQDLGVL